MRVAVIGSRGFNRLTDMPRFLDYLRKNDPNFSIVSGGADGVDKTAEEWARANGVPCTVYPADWEKDGDKAGIKRNADIVENSDAMVAFWDGVSTGTLDSIMRGSKRKNYNVRVFLG